mgnify:CR=1 FL=1
MLTSDYKKIFISFFLLSCIYFLSSYHSIFTEYFFTDDVRYFDNGPGWTIKDAALHYLSMGRPVFSGIITLYGLAVETVSGLSYLRLFICVVNLLSVFLIFLH